MSLKCCVVNCASRCKDISFHRFPKSDAGLKKWVQSINCDRLRSLSFEEIRRKFVCAKHFEKRFFALIQTTRQRVRLRCNAYPTLFTASEISSGIPNAVATPDENYTTKIDHDYCRKRKHEDHTYSKSEFVEKRSKTDITDMEIDDISSQIKLPSTSKSGDKGVQNIKKRQRRRVLSFKNRMSPCCAMLYKQYRKSCRQVNFSLRAKKALKFSKEKSFVKLTEALNPTARQFLWMQIKQCTKKDRGRRFTDEEKLISMAIMKQSPKCYRFLKRIFILPSKYTLNKMIAKLNVEAGINGQIFEAVKQEVVTWDEKKKYCSILFDEVALEVGLSYDKHRDIIDGFVDLNTKTSDFADHALVFMLRGLIHKWQQPVAFYFCKGATSAVILKIIIKDVITAVGNTGLKPVALQAYS